MENEKEEQYLVEDQDLLDVLEAIGPASTGTAATEQTHRLIAAQIKATLRSRKTSDDLICSNEKFSIALIAFALAQLILGLFQFLFDASTSTHQILGFFYAIIAAGMVVYIFVLFLKDKKKEGGE
jgi:hypothetical protein